MTAALAGRTLDDPVELLHRSLALARSTLSAMSAADRWRPTPCAGWTLADLLEHMDDSLDAFTEAAGGEVSPAPGGPAGTSGRGSRAAPTAPSLCAKACRLRDLWVRELGRRDAPATIGIAGHRLPILLLVQAAALEIGVHGWDVGASLHPGFAFPDQLATALLPVALDLVGLDRGDQFAAPLPVTRADSAGVRLLAHLGRSPGVPSLRR